VKKISRALVLFAGITVAIFPPTIAALAAESPASVNQRKLEVAKHLTDRLQDTLKEHHILVAVVSRRGGKDIQKHDITGMAHSGLAVYDPRAQTWLLYNLVNDSTSGQAVASLWRTAPLDFFYGQTGFEEHALVLVPETEIQQRIYQSVLTGKFKKLLFTRNYDLLSRYDSPNSLNCNKWILMNIAAARIDDYDPTHVLQTIHNGFEPSKLRFNALERMALKQKKNVRQHELPPAGPVETVTPQSFYESTLFEQKFLL
jgi:hypothetical protein